jgi:hypothetical protein
VIKFFRTALLHAIALLSIQAAAPFVPGVSAGAIPAAASPAKKKEKFKKLKIKKEKVLKGRHGKHSHKPA